MSETTGVPQKEKVIKRKHKPENRSVLQHTFAAARHSTVNSSGNESQQHDGGILQRQCACGNHTIAGGQCTACQSQERVTALTGVTAKSGSVRNESVDSSVIQSFPESGYDYDFSRTPALTTTGSSQTAGHSSSGVSPAQKSVQGQGDESREDMPAERAVSGKISREPGDDPAPAKKAGIESFETKWSKNAAAGWGKARLRLDYVAKFKKDDDHDPALAEFRQNVMTKWEITDGPGKGSKGDTSPMHDDNYSRADDQAGNTINDVDFTSNDNPGWSDSDMDDENVLDYSFTAEQMIIDTSDGNKEIAKLGPHTGTMKGKDPRTFDGVPKTLSK